MVPRARRLCLTFLLAAGLCPLTGCFGISQNPNYFPWLVPNGDVINTHAKPPGAAYYANFDPKAVRVEVRPVEQTVPVRTQLVLIATVYDVDGKPRRDRRIDWMLQGKGNLIDVDGSGCFNGRGHKVDSFWGYSFTNYHEHRITRGTNEPGDDFIVRPGQTWCVVSSAEEGDTYVTSFAPGIFNWEKSRVYSTIHWVDANWEFPPPARVRAGAEHVLTTRVFRHTDRQPLAKYRVRYKILDGPPAALTTATGRAPEAVAVSDLSGNASVGIAELGPLPGTSRVSVEVIRPPDPTTPSGAGIVLAQAVTTVEWLAAHVTIDHQGPPAVGVGQEIAYTTSARNDGAVESLTQTVTVDIPDGLRYLRSQPPALLEGKKLIWAFRNLAPGQAHTVQAFFQAPGPGTVTNCAAVVTDDGQRDQKCVTTQINQPALKLTLAGPASGVVGTPVTYQVTVSNPGTGALSNVRLSAAFDPALKHQSGANPVALPLGTLAPLEQRVISPPLVLTPQQAGRLKTTVIATADGGLSDSQEHVLDVQRAALKVSLVGPPAKHADRPIEWNIRVTNPGDVPLTNLVLRDPLPPELSFVGATKGGIAQAGEVVWNLGTLPAHAEQIVQVTTRTARTPGKAVHKVTAAADAGVTDEDRKELQILGVPALRLEAVDVGDPAEVGKQVTYQVEVTNTGSLPANQVEIKAVIPDEMQILNATGTTEGKIDKQSVTFAKIEALQPGKSATYNIDVKALRPGDVRFRVVLTSQALREPVVEEESTSIYQASPPPGVSAPNAAVPPVPPPVVPKPKL
jgi:uncharacterized repeat protein (TIGR01451 family)